MGNLKIKDLTKLGYTDNQLRSLVIGITAKHFKHHSTEQLLTLLQDIVLHPEQHLNDAVTGKIAEKLIGKPAEKLFHAHELRPGPLPYKVYGGQHIEAGAQRQMELAMQLPISVQGALMADGHMGFGLPIGGVLATHNAVIPYAVGMDIGCRMALSIMDEGESFFSRYSYQAAQALKNHTHFGMEGGLSTRQEHEVLDSPVFRELPFLRPLHGKAVRHLGTSGNGNHFVEFGIIDLGENNALGLPAKKYAALLSHSGSRGLGAAIAQHYTQLAMNTCKLPRQAQPLAWLDMAAEAGQEYWLAMTFAGDYARACHQRIHANVLKALGLKPVALVENHHNFAWKEALPGGQEVIIHRKGATPAHAGELGIIPGSMIAPAYLVAGQGRPEALYSASHGAGRAMSRQKAKESMTVSALKKMLANAGVTLLGGSVDENPLAYKNIDKVMDAQRALVEVQGRFIPKIVRMSKE